MAVRTRIRSNRLLSFPLEFTPAKTGAGMTIVLICTAMDVHTRIRKFKKHPKLNGIYVIWDELKVSPNSVYTPFCLDNKFVKDK